MFRNTLEKMIDVRDAKRAEREDGEAGFTLIELLVVVVIIGILIAIAIPLYLNYTNGAKNKGAESDVRAAVAAVQQCYTDNNNSFPGTADVTSQGSATGKTSLVLKCGNGPDQTVQLSDGTKTLTYTPGDSDSYKIVGVSTNDQSYHFVSDSTGDGKVELGS